MTAELQDCNGAVGGLRVEHEEVEVQTNPKTILIDENLKLEGEDQVCNGVVRENLKPDEDIEDFSGDGSENSKVNEDSENLKLNEDKVLCNGDASESLKMKEDDKICNGDQIENLNPSDEYEGSDGDGIESWTLIKGEAVCNGDEIENLKASEDETACNGNEGDNLEPNEDKTVCNGDLCESLELVSKCAGSEICTKGIDNDDNLSMDNCKQHEPEFVSVQAKSSDQPPDMKSEDPVSSMPGTVDEVQDLQCLVSENEVESHLIEKGDDVLHSEPLVEDCLNHEVRDLVNEEEEEPELQCLENDKIDVETENSKNEETEHTFEIRVGRDHEVGQPDLIVQDEEKPEQEFEDEENQEKKFDFQIDQVHELESRGVLTEEFKSEPLPVVDMNCEPVALETQNVISEETKPESHMANDEFESGGELQENRHDTSNNVENGTFRINMAEFPALKSSVDKSIELASHVVVNEENTSYLQCWPNGSNIVESHIDASDDKVIESELFVSGSTNLISEDMHGENNDELHHSKDEICDVESGSCNESNPGGVSDTLLETCEISNGTEQSEIQEDKTDIADCVSAVGPDSSNVTSISGNVQKREAEVPKKTFYCLAKIPRHVDNKIKVQIRLAQLQLDEKTQSRDFIKAAIQMKRASREQMLNRLKAARQEERTIREAIRSKRQDMDPLQIALNKIRNASSAEEYDDKIYQMQYRIEHESMPLREEKQLLRDIKQMKISRDELFANTGSHSELEEAFDNIDTIQERIQFLGQQLESLKRQASQAEKNTLVIQKDFEALNDDLRQLQVQWSAADGVRQDAYENLRVLKKQEYERNNEFYQNKSDIQEAKQYALAGERDALDKLCSNQVNWIIEMWVKNADFRREYMKDNERSTLRRLETLDGRSLGPDEEPPLPTNYGDELDSSALPQAKLPSSVTKPEKEDKSTTTLQQPTVVEPKSKVQQPLPKEVVMPLKNSDVKSKKSKKGSLESIPQIESFEVIPEPVKKEEEDLVKKEEEAAKMKELRKLEEMRKAKEAEERKRRLAERANAKALARAQKEAERKEKERQKKANKKAAAVAATVSNMTENDITSSETKNDASHDLQSSPIVESKDLTSTTQKNAPSQRKKSVSQKAKSKSIFPAAAKRNRKGIQTWMLILFAVVFCMFLLILWFYI
ncbi:hypothetical protein SUGI_0427600 [Cryptomeria japonica]|uniref:uncharacterized protein LOC131079050 n=1 Tax=Cryptomeria japonica TaxID=3369 RepID=UPI002408A29C|nr:uncharacterized protein LOC131079050 [Cryptomeria japonica]GLJ22703.1 hypothetical protein SUGI_0427600 [Cryptomeria japonica]